MTLLSTLATVFAVISGFANFPQIYKIYKTKSAKDLSVISFVILAIGSAVWIFYGIEIKSVPVLVMNCLAFFEFVLILIGCYLYGKKKKY